MKCKDGNAAHRPPGRLARCRSGAVLHLSVLMALLAAGPAAAASEWSPAHGAALRLVAGPPAAGVQRAGVEIALDPGWRTYWRTPGDAGVVPVLDWSGSTNVGSVMVAWPAPGRFDEDGAVLIGYEGSVTLPVTVTPADPARPVRLHLAMDYGACARVCVPAHGTVELDLAAVPDPAEAAQVEAALARVPVARPLGSAAPAVLSVAVDAAATPPRLSIVTTGENLPDLFVEGPQGWYLPQPEPAGDHRFTLALDGLPKGADWHGGRLVFTLAGPSGGVETPYALP